MFVYFEIVNFMYNLLDFFVNLGREK